MKEKTFVEILFDSIADKNFKEGKDFIKIDTKKYLILIPFNYGILHDFSMFGKYKILFHCVTCEESYFKKYYDIEFLKRNRIKCFFFDKNIKFDEIPNIQANKKETLWEFTCWLDETDEHIHLFHNCYNHFDGDEIDKQIYKTASKIINNLRKTLFCKLGNYDINKIKEYFKQNYGYIM